MYHTYPLINSNIHTIMDFKILKKVNLKCFWKSIYNKSDNLPSLLKEHRHTSNSILPVDSSRKNLIKRKDGDSMHVHLFGYYCSSNLRSLMIIFHNNIKQQMILIICQIDNSMVIN